MPTPTQCYPRAGRRSLWTDEQLEEKEAAGDLPGRPGELKPEASSLQ
jgi:hypothetical protein